MIKPNFIPSEKEDAWQFLNDVKQGDKLSFRIHRNDKPISLAQVQIRMIFKTDRTLDQKFIQSQNMKTTFRGQNVSFVGDDLNMKYLTGRGFKTQDDLIDRNMIYGYWRNDEIENAIIVNPGLTED